MREGKKGQYPYKLARLSEAPENLAKRWVVIYYAWSVTLGKLVRKRVIVKGDTLEARKKDAASVILQVNAVLKKGAVIDSTPQPTAKSEPTPDRYPNRVTFQSTIAEFLTLKKATLKGNSHKTYKRSLDLFQRYLKEKEQAHIHPNKLTVTQAFAFMDYLINDLKLANKTHNGHLGNLENYYNFFIGREQFTANPFVKVKTLPCRAAKHLAFSPDQIARIREACVLTEDHQLWLFLNFIYYTFARPGQELRLLRVGDIGEKSIRINADDAKNNRQGHILIPKPLEALIQQHQLRDYPASHYVFTGEGLPGEKPTYEKYFYNQHRRILSLLKLRNIGHDLYGWKHTGVIALYRATKDVKLIQRQCRHRTLDQTDQYLRDLGLFLGDEQFDGFLAI